MLRNNIDAVYPSFLGCIDMAEWFLNRTDLVPTREKGYYDNMSAAVKLRLSVARDKSRHDRSVFR